MMPWSNPWFWALLAMIGWGPLFAAFFTVPALGRRLSYGIVMFFFAEVPRLVLPLPFVVQPRIGLHSTPFIWLGSIILSGSLVFGTPVFRIVGLRPLDRCRPLRTDGLYALVRHPLMICDVFWPLGLSLLLGSLVGVLLTPVWLLAIWAGTYLEEESLVRAYGEAYRQYQASVPRLIPRLPRTWQPPTA
jgi:protein-S-isoprenylcysteine O-methyltransferase Ste14